MCVNVDSRCAYTARSVYTAFALTCRLTLTNREVKERGQLTITNRTQKFGRCGRRPRRLLAHAEESKEEE